MKKISLALVTVMLLASLAACGGRSGKGTTSNPTEDPAIANAVRSVDSAKDIEDSIGVDMDVQVEDKKEQKDTSYAVITDSIGETTFKKDGITYDYRACKDLIGDAMAGIQSAMDVNVTNEDVDGISVSFSNFEDGTLIAFWTKEEMNYSLTCKDTDQATLKSTVEFLMEK